MSWRPSGVTAIVAFVPVVVSAVVASSTTPDTVVLAETTAPPSSVSPWSWPALVKSAIVGTVIVGVVMVGEVIVLFVKVCDPVSVTRSVFMSSTWANRLVRVICRLEPSLESVVSDTSTRYTLSLATGIVMAVKSVRRVFAIGNPPFSFLNFYNFWSIYDIQYIKFYH